MPSSTSLDDEYARLVEPFRGELHAHCYRMLGSSDDAEEALQEALLRAWRGLPKFEGRSSLRSWLYRISTNACLDSIQRRKPVVPLDYEPRADDPHDLPSVPVSEAPSPAAEYERRDTVERAFLVALARLHPLPRAVFVMRTALGFSARETAAALDTTVASVNSALQRARKALEEPPADNESGLDALADKSARATVERCTGAMRRGDVATVVRLLADEV
jgi:RNA polymerase sigma-70 factor, ECF subfamily